MKTFRQPLNRFLLRVSLNISGIIFPAFCILGLVLWVFGRDKINIVTLFIILLLGAVGFVLLLLIANYYPDVEIDQSNIYLSFLFYQLEVPLNELIAIESTFPLLPKVNQSFRKPWKPDYVVATHKLTPLHKLYGYIFGYWRYPSFIISNSIKGYDELVSLIEKIVEEKNPD